jgi:hypothetical protein
VIHGTLFLFASHYLFFLGLAAVMTLVWVWGRWNLIGLCTVLAAAVFLSGIAYDNRSIISQWDLDEKDFSEQHLADSIPVFRSLDRSVILSDPLTSSFIASYTDHDVTFTHYVQHELRSHQDLAERYCLTQIFTPNNLRTPEAEHVLIFGAAYDAVYDDAGKNSLREKELQLVQSTCDEVDLDWRNYIKKLNVQYVLWNEKRNPDWNIRRLENEITLVEQGEGWSLWIFD